MILRKLIFLIIFLALPSTVFATSGTISTDPSPANNTPTFIVSPTFTFNSHTDYATVWVRRTRDSVICFDHGSSSELSFEFSSLYGYSDSCPTEVGAGHLTDGTEYMIGGSVYDDVAQAWDDLDVIYITPVATAPTSSPAPTSAAGTSSSTTTVTVLKNVLVTSTPTPTPTPDMQPPHVSITTDIVDKIFTAVPTIEGIATDTNGVESLEYSLDDGRSYLPVDTIAFHRKTSTTFEFTPESLLDDNYVLKIRATDLKGNTGETKIGTFVIDRLPPRIGGNVASLGPQVLVPTPDGSYVIPAGIDFKITLSAVGGPTSIDLHYMNDVGASVNVPLIKNPDNGLWTGTFRFDKAGSYTLNATAIDGAKNTENRIVGTVVVVSNGQVTSGTTPVTNGYVSVYCLDNTMKQFVLWDGSGYGQTNPAPLDSDGRYRLYLPSGTYYFNISAGGYKSLISSIFTIPQAYPIVTNFNLERARAIRIFRLLIPLPDFRVTTAAVAITAPDSGASATVSPLVGREMPYFKFVNGIKTITSLDLSGKQTVITLLNTWFPTATAQMAYLDELAKKQELNVLVIVPQETVSSVAIFKSRGGYSVPVVADPDGDLVNPLNLSTLPTYIILDRKGIVTNVKSGVFVNNELFDMIIQ